MTYWSRSRNELWTKGLTSGHVQYVKSLTIDCDNDTILAKVEQIGAACHTGNRTCFFKPLLKKEYDDTNPLHVFQNVYDVITDRKEHPKEGSYTNYLFDKGIDKILKKVGEECTEIVIAAKNPDKEEIKYEISDFLYHMMVLMVEKGVSWEEITKRIGKKINYISFRKKAFVRRIRMNGYESFFCFPGILKEYVQFRLGMIYLSSKVRKYKKRKRETTNDQN